MKITALENLYVYGMRIVWNRMMLKTGYAKPIYVYRCASVSKNAYHCASSASQANQLCAHPCTHL